MLKGPVKNPNTLLCSSFDTKGTLVLSYFYVTVSHGRPLD